MKYFSLIILVVICACSSLFEKNNKRYILEVDTREVIIQLAAENSENENFKKILFKSDSLHLLQKDKSYSESFFQVLNQSNGISLKDIFANESNKLIIEKNADNSKVKAMIELRINSTVEEMSKLVSERITKAGISKALVEPIKGKSFIKAEANVKNEKEFLGLITAKGKLQFLDVYTMQEIFPALLKLDNFLVKKYPRKAVSENVDDLLPEGASPAEVEEAIEHSDIIILNTDSYGFRFKLKDKSHIISLLNSPEAKEFFPENLEFLWAKPDIGNNPDSISEMLAVKFPGKFDIILTGEDIIDAAFSVRETSYEINFEFNKKGTVEWKKMTWLASKDSNNKRRIAIVLDGTIISAPTVQGEILGGKSNITGDFTLEEARNIVTMMKSKAYPVEVFLFKKEDIK